MSKWECSPAQFMIALLIAGPVLFIWGGIRFAIFYQTTSKCSAETYGQVVDFVDFESLEPIVKSI